MANNMTTYQVEIFTRTAKGKTNHIDNIFVNSDAVKEDVALYFAQRYSPLSVYVTEIKTIEINKKPEDKKEFIVKEKDGSMYSDPEYTISRKMLPDDVKKLLDHLGTLEKDISDTKTSVNKIMRDFFSSGGQMVSYSRDSITCRGYIKAWALKLNRSEKDE